MLTKAEKAMKLTHVNTATLTVCQECNSAWPCDVVVLLATVKQLRQEISGAMDSLESEIPAERKARWERLQALFD